MSSEVHTIGRLDQDVVCVFGAVSIVIETKSLGAESRGRGLRSHLDEGTVHRVGLIEDTLASLSQLAIARYS